MKRSTPSHCKIVIPPTEVPHSPLSVSLRQFRCIRCFRQTAALISHDQVRQFDALAADAMPGALDQLPDLVLSSVAEAA